MMKKFHLLFLLPAILLLASGCMAVRSTTNIHAPADAGTLSVRHKFKVETVEYTLTNDRPGVLMGVPMQPEHLPGKNAQEMGMLIWNNQKWTDELTKLGASRYPGIFSSGPDAYPLSITLRLSGHPPSILSIIGPELLTLCVLGGILPLPVREHVDFIVTPALLLDEGMTQISLASVQFQRREVMWMTIFTPLGLIPVFVKADKRQSMSLAEMMNPPAPPAYTLNVESCVDAIVLSIQSSLEELREALKNRSRAGDQASPLK